MESSPLRYPVENVAQVKQSNTSRISFASCDRILFSMLITLYINKLVLFVV